MARILIQEPNSCLSALIRETLLKRRYWAVVAENFEATSDLLAKQFFHLVICPIESLQDVDRLSQLKRIRPETAILVTSGDSNCEHVVRCIRAGAAHFWAREENIDGLLKLIEEMIGQVDLEEKGGSDQLPFPWLVGNHPLMREIARLVQMVRDTDSNVLITGESGTGKELIAKAVHMISARRRQPWVAVNCGAIPATLLESELFGHVKGAFTGAIQNRPGRFQLAQNGTLFLDEIGDLPFDLQAKILRAIQNRTFEPVGSAHSVQLEARIITATNQDLETAVTEKRFREDLYYRLNVIPIYVPALRQRRSDIPLLVRSFIDRFVQSLGRKCSGISEEAMQILVNYHWPGNVRELENFIERVIVLKQTEGLIEVRDFPQGYFRSLSIKRYVASVNLPEDGIDLNHAIDEFENELILQALQKTAGNKNRAASLLHLNRTTLVEKLKRKGLLL